MAMKLSRIDVWVAAVLDRPGALAQKLHALAEAGASLDFVLARRAPEKPGKGVVFAAPIGGRRQLAAARKAGFRKSRSLCAIRVEGADRPGMGARLTEALAAAGINLRGLSAGVVSKRFVMHLALDKAADAAKATRILKKL